MKKFERQFTVETYQTQATGDIHIHTLMQYLQESASEHAHELGFGYDDLKKMDCYWVLVNFKIIINSLPKWREKFLIQTWPSGHDRLKAYREFMGLDSEENILFSASSDWMIIDIKEGRPKNLNEVDLNLTYDTDRVIDGLKRLKPDKDYIESMTPLVEDVYYKLKLYSNPDADKEYALRQLKQIRRTYWSAYRVMTKKKFDKSWEDNL